MQSKEVKRLDAQTRANLSTFVAPEKSCQKCKFHTNSPSYCKNLKQYVGRKQFACEDFKR